jgi:integrase
MPTNNLTDAQVKRLTPRDKPFKVFDGGGLFLYVTATAKIWRFAYRIEGKQQTKSFGAYPLVTLAQARDKRDKAKTALMHGERLTKAPRVQNRTLREVCEEYWSSRKDLSAGYLQNAQSAIERYVLPRFGSVAIDEFSRDDLMSVLNAMNSAEKFVYLRKLRMWLSQALDYAVEQRLTPINVAAAIKTERAFGRRRVEHFASLPLEEVGAFLMRVGLEREGLDSVLANELLARTWMRTGELRFLKVSDLGRSPGLEVPRLLIPAERMKRAKDLIVPLSAQAVALIDQALLQNRGSDYVFPASHRLDRPISENTVLALIARVGYKGRMTGHGWRSMASTWANEAGFSADAIERQLAHQPADEVRAAYNRAKYLKERTTMLQAWSDWLDEQRQSAEQATHRCVAST